jgi:hypothetical protein
MEHTNIASGDEVVAVQVGQVLGCRADESVEQPAAAAEPGTSTTINIRRGNARVGAQVDEIVGDLRL